MRWHRVDKLAALLRDSLPAALRRPLRPRMDRGAGRVSRVAPSPGTNWPDRRSPCCWGLLAGNASKDILLGATRPINACSETVATRASFQEAHWRHRRCPAWRLMAFMNERPARGGRKQPWLIRRRDRRRFWLGALGPLDRSPMSSRGNAVA